MPGTQLHKSKEQNNDQDSNERANQNSYKKRQPNDHARIQPLSRHGIATNPSLLDKTGEDLAEGASFWHAFLTPFWGPETIVMFKRNYVEAMFRLSQIQDKPSKSFDQNQPDITFVKKLVQSTNVFEAKGYMTKPKQKK